MGYTREILYLSQQSKQVSQASQVSHVSQGTRVPPDTQSKQQLVALQPQGMLQGYEKLKQRSSVQTFLLNRITERGLSFQHFITLSFYNPRRDVSLSRMDNSHIKNVILDFFYTKRGKRSADRMRMWFFNERHTDGDIHVHILMEGISPVCRERVHRRIFIDTDGVCGTLDDNAILYALTEHLRKHVTRIGTGYKGIDIRPIGDLHKRIIYVNKSMEREDFEGIDHIDITNSDL